MSVKIQANMQIHVHVYIYIYMIKITSSIIISSNEFFLVGARGIFVSL